MFPTSQQRGSLKIFLSMPPPHVKKEIRCADSSLVLKSVSRAWEEQHLAAFPGDVFTENELPSGQTRAGSKARLGLWACWQMKGAVRRGHAWGRIRLPAATSRCDHGPRPCCCCWKLPAVGQEAYSWPRERKTGRQRAHYPTHSFPLTLFSLLGIQFPPPYPFVFIPTRPSLPFFLYLSHFPLYHASPP